MGEVFITRRGGNTTLDSIIITRPPDKTTYHIGETFDPSGMIVEIDIGDTRFAISDYEIMNATISVGQTSVDIAYTLDDVTKAVKQSVTASSISSILEENSWETIREISDAGIGSQYWNIGDSKMIVMNGEIGSSVSVNGAVWRAYIIGFDHNAEYEGSGRIHFALFKENASPYSAMALTESAYGTYSSDASFIMKNAANNGGGWKESQLRTNIATDILAALPSDLRSCVKEVSKYTDNVGMGSGAASNVSVTTDVLFALSEYEIHGRTQLSNPAENNYQKQYAYFAAGNTKKRIGAANRNDVIYWTRSPRVGYTNHYCAVDANGNPTSMPANYSYALVFGFCI